jgi:hypothetical protein
MINPARMPAAWPTSGLYQQSRTKIGKTARRIFRAGRIKLFKGSLSGFREKCGVKNIGRHLRFLMHFFKNLGNSLKKSLF